RTFVDDVIDAAHEGVRRGLVLAGQVERLHLPDELRVGRRQDRPLAGEVLLLPTEDVAHEPRRLVIEVVPGREHVEPALDRGAIEVVSLHLAARRARRSTREACDGRDGEPVGLLVERDDPERKAARRREGGGLRVRLVGIRPDAEPEVEAGRVVAELREHVPEREAVLPARDRNEDALAGREHPLRRDGAFDLSAEEKQKTRPAEGRVVRPELHLGARPAARALHAAPPEMTARISTSSDSSTTSPSVKSSSRRITIAVPGSTPSSARSCATRRRPSSSTVRC